VLVGARPTLLTTAVGTLRPGWFGVAELLAVVVAAAALAFWLARAPQAARLRAVVGGGLRTGVADARSGVFSRATWPALLLLSVVALAGYLALFVVAARAAGSHAALRDLLPLLVLGLLAMALPLNVGGWGPREGVTAAAFGTVGFGAAQGLTTAVVYGVLSLIACLPGAVVLVLSVTRAAAARRASGRRAAHVGEECRVIEPGRSPFTTTPLGTAPLSVGEVVL
jgi:uncharacterized membrane protein YbhN (UPF0104 family)